MTDGQTQGPCANWSFDSNTNRITTSGFSYDAAGNTTADGTGVGTHSYQWDAEGRLVSVDGVAGQACQASWTGCYVYNAFGERVEKQTGATYNELVYDGYGNLVFIHDRTNWPQDIIPFYGHRPIARYHNGNTEFLHGDALGSSVYITEQPGWVSQKLLFYPWGQRWASWGVLDERFASLGERDAETGNDPTPFRMYNPRLYRWLSPDPIAGDIRNPQSLNRYAYVLNNPTNFIDPLGLTCVQSDDGATVDNLDGEGCDQVTGDTGGQNYVTGQADHISESEAIEAVAELMNMGNQSSWLSANAGSINTGPNIGQVPPKREEPPKIEDATPGCLSFWFNEATGGLLSFAGGVASHVAVEKGAKPASELMYNETFREVVTKAVPGAGMTARRFAFLGRFAKWTPVLMYVDAIVKVGKADYKTYEARKSGGCKP